MRFCTPAYNESRASSAPEIPDTGPTASQNTQFLPCSVGSAVARSHCAYTRRDGQAEFAWWLRTVTSVLTRFDIL